MDLLPKLTPEEQEALVNAIVRGYGPCTCRPVNGSIMQCEGHRFLSETQAFGVDRKIIDRVTRMVYARREAHVWAAQEFGRPFTLEPEPMPEPDPLPPDLLGPPRPVVSPQKGDDVLPW